MPTACDNNTIFKKDKDAKLDFKFDWKAFTNGSGKSDWLQSGEVITGYVLTVPAGITEVSSYLSDSATSVTVWLSGGAIDTIYDILCHITTDSSPVNREDDRTMHIEIVEK
jgi:hypothetical protein